MRFAGSEPVTNYLKSSVNMGGVAQAGAKHRSAIRNAATALEGQVGAAGVNAAGQVEAASIIADAGVAQAQAQGNAAMMQGIGGIASSAIGAFGGGGGGGFSGASMKSSITPSASSWNSMSNFVGNFNPAGL